MTSSQATSSTQTSVPVEHLFTLTATPLTAQVIEGGPQGSRRIINVPSGSVVGTRIRGTIVEPSGDWLSVRSDGSSKLDVRALIRTEDGALILMTYNGIGVPRSEGGFSIRTAPLFETSDSRYAWLNRVQAIGIGETPAARDRLTYEVFALK